VIVRVEVQDELVGVPIGAALTVRAAHRAADLLVRHEEAVVDARRGPVYPNPPK
jgi:hypothetical protein